MNLPSQHPVETLRALRPHPKEATEEPRILQIYGDLSSRDFKGREKYLLSRTYHPPANENFADCSFYNCTCFGMFSSITTTSFNVPPQWLVANQQR